MVAANRWDNFWLGLFFGAIGLVLGFFALGFVWGLLNDADLNYWIDTVWIGVPIYRTQVLTGSSLLNGLAFFILYQKGYYNLAKGVLGTIVLLVLYMVITFW